MFKRYKCCSLIYKKSRGRQCRADTAAAQSSLVPWFLLFLFLASYDFHSQGYHMDQDGCWSFSYYLWFQEQEGRRRKKLKKYPILLTCVSSSSTLHRTQSHGIVALTGSVLCRFPVGLIISMNKIRILLMTRKGKMYVLVGSPLCLPHTISWLQGI